MGITLSTFGGLFGPLQEFMEWFAPRARRVEPMVSRGHAAAAPSAAMRACASRPAAVRPCEKIRRPLRVVRVVEGVGVVGVVGAAGISPGAGRIFMSGRMADVCAELDRLAALEAAAS